MRTALSSNTFGIRVSSPLSEFVYRSLGYTGVFYVMVGFITMGVVLSINDDREKDRCEASLRIMVGHYQWKFRRVLRHFQRVEYEVRVLCSPSASIRVVYENLLALIHVCSPTCCSTPAVVPLVVRRTFHSSSLGLVLTFLDISLLAAFLSPTVGKALHKIGAGWIAVNGTLLLFSQVWS